MIDSMIEPQPGERRGINTINEEGPGLQKRRSPTPAPHFPIATLTSSARRRRTRFGRGPAPRCSSGTAPSTGRCGWLRDPLGMWGLSWRVVRASGAGS
jgi:hypothetical protein